MRERTGHTVFSRDSVMGSMIRQWGRSVVCTTWLRACLEGRGYHGKARPAIREDEIGFSRRGNSGRIRRVYSLGLMEQATRSRTLDERTEAQVIAACRAGDRDAYARLVRKYSRGVFAVCMGILGNVDDAEDMAQDALVRGFTRIRLLRDGEQFKPWIFRIARNLCIDLLRRRRIGRGALEKHQEEAERRDLPAEDYTFLERAIGRLPEKYRLPLMLYYFGGKSTEAVAEALGISPAGVCSRLSRARQRLRTILEEQRGYDA